MNPLFKSLTKFIVEAAPKKKSPVPAGLFAGPFGKYYKDQELQQYAGKVVSGRWVPASAEPDTAAPKKPVAPAPAKPVKPMTTVGKPSATGDIKQAASALPGGKGALDAVKGVIETGSAGAGTPESRAAEASVVLISNSLLQGRKNFKGNMDEYLSQNDDTINSMISELMSMPGSRLTADWQKSVKAQIVATLSQTEKKYGKIESLVWDNAEGRSSMGLPKSKDMNDRSDLYVRTESGEVVGVSLKKSGRIFLANQGYSKIISTIEGFTEDDATKSKIQKLKKLHKVAADKSFQQLSEFIKDNKGTVVGALSKFDRTGIKSLSSPKYDPFFTSDGKLNKQFLSKITSGEKLSSNEFKAMVKSLDGVKKQNPEIKKIMDSLRDVDIKATKLFLNQIESDKKIREATTRYLLDALDIPQMITLNPSQGIDHVVTVYGEGNVDASGDPIPMYVNGDSIRDTFGIDKNTSQENALQELRTRFIIDAESDKRVGMIRLRITNKTPPPNYYYPTIATLALRARGLGTAAAFELYQHESWTYTLASKSPNPQDWTPQQRKKQAESTLKFLERQSKNDLISKQERDELRKDIEFYSKIK